MSAKIFRFLLDFADYNEALKWYRKAAEQGDANAQYFLGLMYDNGQGVEMDYAEALKWYHKAAEQANTYAQNNLGLMYANGLGVERDYVEAYAWMNLAAKVDKQAAKNRDIIEKKMSPQQFAEAQKRIKELRTLIETKMKRE